MKSKDALTTILNCLYFSFTPSTTDCNKPTYPTIAGPYLCCTAAIINLSSSTLYIIEITNIDNTYINISAYSSTNPPYDAMKLYNYYVWLSYISPIE